MKDQAYLIIYYGNTLFTPAAENADQVNVSTSLGFGSIASTGCASRD